MASAQRSNGSLTECVVNVSEGRDRAVVDALTSAGGETVADVHTDPDHHRTVLTLAGPLDDVAEAARSVATQAVARIDLTAHDGVHPRLGALDVVPFVALAPSLARPDGALLSQALDARDHFAAWAGESLELPCFLYGPERTLPEVRRGAFTTLVPAAGPPVPHPTAGASAVGARPVLIAYNVWIGDGGGDTDGRLAHAAASAIASALRSPSVRALGLPLGARAQVSLNLIDPTVTSIADLYDSVAVAAARRGCAVIRAELVGLAPLSAVTAVPQHRWAELDLAEERTIEARLEDRTRS